MKVKTTVTSKKDFVFTASTSKYNVNILFVTSYFEYLISYQSIVSAFVSTILCCNFPNVESSVKDHDLTATPPSTFYCSTSVFLGGCMYYALLPSFLSFPHAALGIKEVMKQKPTRNESSSGDMRESTGRTKRRLAS